MASLLLAFIYIAFISLGLPDSLLGSGWPAMYGELGAPVAAQSFITIIITISTIVSSLATAPLMRKLGTGKLVAGSVALTAAAILGFSASTNIIMLCLIAVPYGLGAGAIDSVLNNYVAIHYGERHMSWLHCFWGIGTSVSPMIMGWALAGPLGWHGGYLTVGIIQCVITALMVFSLPLWKKNGDDSELSEEEASELTYAKALKLRGAKTAIAAFICYAAFEYVCGLWISSYLTLARGTAESQAASMVSFFYIGITLGRLGSGFIAPKLGSQKMIRYGQIVAAAGLALLVLGKGEPMLSAALILIGLGCAPIYPCIISLTPVRFGEAASQTMVSLQMALYYVGSTLAPIAASLMVGAGGAVFIPAFLAAILVAMFVFSEATNRSLSE